MNLEIIVPLLMSCALLWWIGRGMSWSVRLIVTVVTLALILAVLGYEQSTR